MVLGRDGGFAGGHNRAIASCRIEYGAVLVFDVGLTTTGTTTATTICRSSSAAGGGGVVTAAGSGGELVVVAARSRRVPAAVIVIGGRLRDDGVAVAGRGGLAATGNGCASISGRTATLLWLPLQPDQISPGRYSQNAAPPFYLSSILVPCRLIWHRRQRTWSHRNIHVAGTEETKSNITQPALL